MLYEGPRCDRAKVFDKAAKSRHIKHESFAFGGEFVLNKRKMATRNKLTLYLPDKKHEPGHGHRDIATGRAFKKLVKILPEDDDTLNVRVYNRCAIVGSSGIVLSYEHGKDIDEHDMVVRFNSAPTKKFRKHVGSFTTHRITNSQNWGFKESPDEHLFIHLRSMSSLEVSSERGGSNSPDPRPKTQSHHTRQRPCANSNALTHIHRPT